MVSRVDQHVLLRKSNRTLFRCRTHRARTRASSPENTPAPRWIRMCQPDTACMGLQVSPATHRQSGLLLVASTPRKGGVRRIATLLSEAKDLCGVESGGCSVRYTDFVSEKGAQPTAWRAHRSHGPKTFVWGQLVSHNLSVRPRFLPICFFSPPPSLPLLAFSLFKSCPHLPSLPVPAPLPIPECFKAMKCENRPRSVFISTKTCLHHSGCGSTSCKTWMAPNLRALSFFVLLFQVPRGLCG